MKKQKITALLLAAALALSLGDVPVLATEGGAETELPDSQSAAQETTESVQPELVQDPEGALSFANLDRRVREGCLDYLILEENILLIEANDYERMEDQLRDALNGIAEQQWALYSVPSNFPDTGNTGQNYVNQTLASLSTSTTTQSLQQMYNTYRDQFDALRDGDLQKDAADGIRQLKNVQNTIVMLAQGVYVQLAELDATSETLDRSLAALDRQIQELELRHELGQISALTLQQSKTGRASLISSQRTLASSAQTGLMNLEAMIGAPLTGGLQLTALPTVTAEELADMDLEADLAAAKEASYDLYAAKKTLDDAEEAYKDAASDYHYDESRYEFVQAKHTWQAAQYTYQGAIQNFELSFRSLYAQVQDYQQVLEAAKASLAAERDNYAVDQLKYEQGTISKNTLLTAEDDLNAARDTVATAERNLFSAYNNYRWAVDCGILN